MKNRNIFIVIAILFIITLAIGLSLNLKKSDSGKIQIVTSLFPFYDIAKQIGGNKADVNLLLPPGVEAHSFEPKPSDIIKINNADIFIYTSDLLEPWANDILKGFTDNSTQVIKASNGIQSITEEGTTSNEIDPHIWLDFSNMVKITKSVGETIISLDKSNEAFYQSNIDKYIASLVKLDNDYKNGLSNCKTKDLVYSGHYAFGYLVKRYNLNFKSAYGAAPDSEPSAQDIANLVNYIKANNAKYVFSEELLSQSVAQMLSSETNTKILILNPAHNITKNDFDKMATFVSIMKYNLENLKTGLQCQ